MVNLKYPGTCLVHPVMRQNFVNTVGLVCKLDLAVCLLLREKCQKGAAPAEQMMADVSWRYIKRISAGMYIVRMPFYLLYRLSHLGNTRIPLFLLCIAPTIQPCLNRFAVMERKLPSDIKVELPCKLLKLLIIAYTVYAACTAYTA